jgi:hypothetical protein
MALDIKKLRHDPSHNSIIGEEAARRFLDESGLREWLVNSVLLVGLPQKICLHCLLAVITGDIQKIIDDLESRTHEGSSGHSGDTVPAPRRS